jgi:N6-adenosine-specific RNA methylase IME4
VLDYVPVEQTAQGVPEPQADVRHLEELGEHSDDDARSYEQKKTEAQEIAEAVTLAEMRTGELLKAIPKAKENQYTKMQIDTSVEKQKPKSETIKELGFTQKQAERMQTLAENPEIVKEAIQEARDNDDIVSRAFVLGKIKQVKRKENIQKQVDDIENSVMDKPDGLFDVIAIDPPWNYGTQFNASGRRVANPYPEMTQEQLKAIEVPASDNCVMFLWTTHKFIWDAKELLDTWGFEYRSMLVWDKQKIGMGDLLRMQCEFCLIGIKGKPVFRDNHSVRDIISESRREHSRKPEGFYSLVD